MRIQSQKNYEGKINRLGERKILRMQLLKPLRGEKFKESETMSDVIYMDIMEARMVYKHRRI